MARSRSRSLSRFAILALALLMSLSPVPASAHQAHQDRPDRIDLPDGWQPEGITTDGQFLFSGSLADGAILRANPRNGNTRIIARGREGRMAVGVDYDRSRDLLWVAGGGTKTIRAYDAHSGALLARYDFPSAGDRFINDLVVRRRGVFATDSFNQELLIVRLRLGDRLPGPRAATTRPLTGDLVYQDGFNLNGIVRSGRRLIAVQSNTGLLFRINPFTGRTRMIDLDGFLVTNGDGLEIDGDILYVVRNQNNEIAVVDLNRRLTRGNVVDQITDDDFDTPTTVALLGQSLYAVNARFTTTPTAETDYWITRVDAFDEDD
jgi:sugar lactone lactonase YvrE